ncbi:hypothetical protein NLI96_g2510 [Meripilus lineatus]|uniref:Aldehyde dehydrogenase n=1 Tax=Meripilus lineatus TaxID=2056292 RepID=A0AAD5V8M4_9APHY|nr:hypothetical protein NLI96_g2510 [Physisporinus lineatus]
MADFKPTPIEEIGQIRNTLKKGYQSGKTKPLEFRRNQLIQLGYMMKDNAQRFKEALASDLGRPHQETEFLETNAILGEVKYAIDNLKNWTKPEKLPFMFNWFAMRPTVRKEPKGTVMIISPFNFPVVLLIGPLCGALAAGCTVLLKPSELAPAFAALVAELVPKYLDPDVVQVVNGAVPETTKLLEFHWDHILYTGSGRVARIVLTAAAKNLTPVTTELGGKSPVFIDPNSDLRLAARRIMWGKATNSGQTCVAPDYILIPRDAQDKFVEELKAVYAEFYPTPIKESPDYARMVSVQHAKRAEDLIKQSKGTVVIGGETDVEKKFVAVTILKDVKFDDVLMSEYDSFPESHVFRLLIANSSELFAPILPIVPVQDVDEAIAYVNDHDHPLALYVFSQDDKYKAKVFDNTQSGACLANELLVHIGTPGLPFGGVGPSGSGATTGKFNFDTFTHLRSTLDSPGWVDKIALGVRFPPYTQDKSNWLAKMQKVDLPPRPGDKQGSRWPLWLVLAVVGAASSLLMRNGYLSGLIRG